MPTKLLPLKPSVDHLNQAKDLLQQHRLQEPNCAQRLREFHPRFAGLANDLIFSTSLTLGDAQLTLACEYGFASWPRLRSCVEDPPPSDDLRLPHHERIDDPLFSDAVHLIDSGHTSALSRLLEEHSMLIRERVRFEGGNYFRNPALLEFIAENLYETAFYPKTLSRSQTFCCWLALTMTL